MTASTTDTERLRRWRLILGGDEADGIRCSLSAGDNTMDRALAALYDADKQRGGASKRSGGLGASMPSVARWLGDIRSFFPSSVVRVMQQDAMERLNLRQMLLEPELLAAVEPDVHLAATLVSLSRVLPGKTRETARRVVAQVGAELERRLAGPPR